MSCGTASPLSITVGGDHTFTFVLKSNGTPINLTGSTVRLYVSLSPDREDLLVKSTEDEEEAVIVDASAGKVKFIFTPSDTDPQQSGLRPRKYVYDIWIETAAGKHLPTTHPSVFAVTEGVGR